MAKKYLLYIHEEKFETEPKKSELVNYLLRKHYGKELIVAVDEKTYQKAIKLQKPLDIPGVVKASEVTPPEKCPGSHTIRMNCGRLGCPY